MSTVAQRAASARWRAKNREHVAEYRRNYKRAHPDTDRTEHRRWKATLVGKRMLKHTFCAIDGEGWTVDGLHRYGMIVTSLPDVALYTGRPLTGVECLDFIADLPVQKDRVWVSYYFDYDVTMILRDLAVSDPAKAAQLFTRTSRRYVWWRGFGIRYRAHKQFVVKRWTPGNTAPAVQLHDVQGFYQTAFVAALRKNGIGTAAELDELQRMKDDRADFDPSRATEIQAYSLQECTLLVSLLERLRDQSEAVRLNPYPYEGPGALASRALERYYGKARHAAVLAATPEHVQQATHAAMYGGRFETPAVGGVQGLVREYDLHSAYPAQLRDLPCFVHGRWSTTRTRHGEYALSHLTFTGREPEGPGVCYPLPVRRRTGELFYPRSGSGWYWRHEYDADDLAVTLDVTYSWIPDGCDCNPFGWVQDVYDERERLERDRKGSGLPIKLSLNTLYGKQAQTRPEPGPWLCMLHASIITSRVRRTVFDYYRQLPPRTVVMFATDAVFCHDQELPTSDELGGLEHAADYDQLVIVQPGVYFDAGDAHFKTRGMPKRVMAEHGTGLTLAAIGGEPYVITMTQFQGVRMALAQGHPERAGQWLRVTREIETRTTSKRVGSQWLDDGRGSVCWTTPAAPIGESRLRHDAMAAAETFGLRDLWSDDQPVGED